MFKLTEKEKIVMNACMNTDFGSALVEPIWSLAVACSAKMDPKIYRGVVSSLVKKGLVVIYDYEGKGKSSDMVFALTEAGKAYFKGE